ncbi:MAG: 2Fe-2S iron-sulfur cluster binding domain-containing protein [Deltaproteobacteria bacterium]|nr:2Fe-2S iron-sulfur cluster binding domain-containing protein [Deltaproteobacteria bacterium]
MIAITINGKNIEVEEGTTLLKAARDQGIPIPTLCDHPALTADGNCRVCLTEIEIRGKKKLVTACNYPVREELAAFTKSEQVLEQRRNLLSLMLARWPNVPVLQDLAATCGAEPAAIAHPRRSESKDACVLCGRCVRACSEITWENIIGFAGRGDDRHVSMPFGEQYSRCIGCATCASVCPTGAITVYDEKNNPVDPKRIARYGVKLGEQMATLDDHQCGMRRFGTANLVDVMDAYDLLPTFNYKYGSHDEAKNLYRETWRKLFTQDTPDGCWAGCMMSCAHCVEGFEVQTGPYKGDKVTVDGPEYETAAGCGSNIGVFDPLIVVELNFYCDTYGIDTISFGTAMAFAMECYENDILDKDKTGGFDLSFGQGLNALEMLHQMARGEGFGVVVGQGVRKMKEKFTKEYDADKAFLQDIGMECKGLEYSEYVSKESLAQQGGFALASKGPQHDEAWLIFMDMVNKQIPTFDDKAEALHFFPNFRTWFGLMGLCKLPWNDVEPSDNALADEPHKVPDHLEGYYNFYAGVTGKEIDEQKMIVQSEKVYNFQRVFNLRMGYGTREHDYGPYRAMGPVTEEEYLSRQDRYDTQLKEIVGIDPEKLLTAEKVQAMREYRYDQYDGLVDAVYKRRGWTKNGVPTLETLKRLGIDFPWVVEVVAPHQE